MVPWRSAGVDFSRYRLLTPHWGVAAALPARARSLNKNLAAKTQWEKGLRREKECLLPLPASLRRASASPVTRPFVDGLFSMVFLNHFFFSTEVIQGDP